MLSGFIFLQSLAAPRDLPLALPLPEWFLIAVLIISFLLHIIFVDLMLGGVLLTLWAQIKGLKEPEYDHLAHEIAATVTVNKSMAVVLGVGPLLSINVLYTLYFYTANALTGAVWIMIIPLVTVAFLLTYLHKYTWEKLEHNKPLHISIIALATAIFLFIPFIFLANANLMLFPEKWDTVKGFLSAILLPNVFPRYIFFIFSTLAVSGLFMAWYFGKKEYEWSSHFERLQQYDVRKKFYSLTLAALFIQLVLAGPILLATLPAKGMSWNVTMIVLLGAALVTLPIYWLWKSVTGPQEMLDRHFRKIAATLLVTVSIMGMGRHAYRAHALAPHQAMTAKTTSEFEALSAQARAEANDPARLEARKRNLGPEVFQSSCSTCHDQNATLVGPPVTEMVSIYKDNPEALKQWIVSPGKKRPEATQMPGFPQLSKEELEALTNYILTQQ